MMARLVAVVPAADAELTRRALDRDGLLDVGAKAFRTEDGLVALPLMRAPAEPDSSPPKMAVCLLEPPSGCGERGPGAAMRAACARAVEGFPASEELLAAVLAPHALPRRWEKLGDVVLFAHAGLFDETSPAGAAFAALPVEARTAIWAALASELGATRLGVQGRIEQSLHRKSRARLLWPETDGAGWTVHRDNGIMYGLDVTRSMFSSGNGTEKTRVARFPCAGETVVDLYAGIGYFTLAYLVHAGAAHVHACEWDDDAVQALRHNLTANRVSDRCTVHVGDNVASAPKLRGVAHRVNLGLIPSSEAGWPVAIEALRAEGGLLHVHANVGSAEADEAAWCDAMLATFRTLSEAAGRDWTVSVEHVERVKWYAPRIRHVVADVRCASVGS